MYKYINRKLFHVNTVKMRSVFNIDKDDFFPFINQSIVSIIGKIEQGNSSYAVVYPNQIAEYLKNQEKEYNTQDNIEVK